MIIIYENKFGGHHGEYLIHLVDYIGSQSVDQRKRYLFFVHPDYEGAFENYDGLQVEYICRKTIEKTDEYGNFVKKYFSEYRLITKKATEHNATKVFFMFLDSQIPLLIFLGRKIQISGILFHPFFREVSSLEVKRPFLFKARRLKKWFQGHIFRASCKGPLFILNDVAAVEHYKTKAGFQYFEYLPDPLPPSSGGGWKNIRELYGISESNRIVLAVGRIAPRKNTLALLKALKVMREEERSKITLILAGTCQDGNLESEIEIQINWLHQHSKVQIIWEKIWMTASLLDSLFHASNLIFAAYNDFYTSSGMIGHAARHRKAILVSHYGLMSEIVPRYELGLTVDPTNYNQIAMRVIECFNYNVNEAKSQTYLRERTPKLFASIIFGGINIKKE